MVAILLKSSICLAFFMLFYKLCLEKTSVHNFKRFYLLGVLLISIGIPFITFTEYIEIEPATFNPNFPPLNYSTNELTEIEQSKDYLPTIIWSIYALGVIFFPLDFSRI